MNQFWIFIHEKTYHKLMIELLIKIDLLIVF